MSLFTAIRENSLGLAIFAVITAGAIALTQAATEPLIEHNREAAATKALYDIVPKSKIDNDLLRDTVTIEDARSIGYNQPVKAHIARKNGEVLAVIFPVIAPDGYTGNIELLVGVRADSSLAGVRVLSHQETPGLGDKVELKKSDWLLDFTGESLDGADDPSWAVQKDGGRFDQFTGATITPRAVVNASKRTILLFNTHKDELLTATPANATNTAEDANNG